MLDATSEKPKATKSPASNGGAFFMRGIKCFQLPASSFQLPASSFQRLPSPVSRLPSPVSRLPSPVSRLPSPVSRHPSPVTRPPSPVTRHPSFYPFSIVVDTFCTAAYNSRPLISGGNELLHIKLGVW